MENSDRINDCHVLSEKLFNSQKARTIKISFYKSVTFI